MRSTPTVAAFVQRLRPRKINQAASLRESKAALTLCSERGEFGAGVANHFVQLSRPAQRAP